MMKYMNLKNFLQNPTGKSSASFARRDLIIANLEQRYSDIRNKNGFFETRCIKDGNDYVFWVKVPSEKFGSSLFYDVVIAFRENNQIMRTQNTLSSYAINVFSNSPNFTFTYAYVYNQDGIIFNKLIKKLAPKSLTDAPNVKNPDLSYGFEKSVYYALLWLKERNFTTKIGANSVINSSKITYKEMNRDILTSTQKLKKYQEQDKIEKIKKKDNNKSDSKERKKQRNEERGVKTVKPQKVKKIQKVKKVEKVKKIKKR